MAARLGSLFLGALVFAGATYAAGWWAVPVVAALWAVVVPRVRAAPITLSAAIAWTALLAGQAAAFAVGRLAERLGGILGVPGWVLLALVPALAAAFAWSAATLVLVLKPSSRLLLERNV